jgi:hypothetical protein
VSLPPLGSTLTGWVQPPPTPGFGYSWSPRTLILLHLPMPRFEPIGAIGAAGDRNELLEHENKCQDALKALITAAAAHVR